MNSDMKDICIITVADAINGTSMPINEFVIFRANNFREQKQVLIVCTDEEYNGVSIPNNVKVIFVKRDVKLMKRALKETIKQCNADGVDYVFHIHGQSSSSVFILAAMFMGIRKRTLFTVHSLCSARNLKYRISSYICALFANKVTCVSDSVLQDYQSIIKLIKGNRMSAITNAVDMSHLEEYVSSLPNHIDVCDMKRLICIDRVVPLKNQEFLVRLLKKIPDSKLVLVGSPDKERRIETLAKALDVIDRVEFTGLLKREEVYYQLNISGIYVSASTIEGLHNSVLESMGVGVVPVISDIPAHREISQKTGCFRVLPFDENLWVEYIKNIQGLEREELIKLSNSLKIAVKKNFSLLDMHQKYDNIYQYLVNY